MPHADASILPSHITSKKDFYNHVNDQLISLIGSQRNWSLGDQQISNCANAASLLFSSLKGFDHFFGSESRAVNWCGFYIDNSLYPRPSLSASKEPGDIHLENKLLLGPFCGKPACQFINVAPDKARGVCADAFVRRQVLVVPDVDNYPGHIACDGETKSEIVCPLILGDRCIGVLDLDCLALDAFDEDDRVGLELIAKSIVDACDW